MSKKDFISMANFIRDHNKLSQSTFSKEQVEVLALFCQTTNSRFNRSRWLAYIAGECGPNGGKL